MKKKWKWLVGKMKCVFLDLHTYDLGYDDIKEWEAWVNDQLAAVGHVDCRCKYCGQVCLRIVPSIEEDEAANENNE